jgi:hypothetical protein
MEVALNSLEGVKKRIGVFDAIQLEKLSLSGGG